MSTQTTADTATTTETTHADATISGVRLSFTAKGYIQPEITTRYANADEALERAVTDAFTLYDLTVKQAHARGLLLVTDMGAK